MAGRSLAGRSGLGTVEARIGASLPTHETRYGKEPTPREQTQDRHARLNHVLHDVTAALARHEAERCAVLHSGRRGAGEYSKAMTASRHSVVHSCPPASAALSTSWHHSLMPKIASVACGIAPFGLRRCARAR